MTNDKLLRFPEVQKLTGLARSTIHALGAKGTFPKPIKLSDGGRASAWIQSEIELWMKSRIDSRNNQ